MGRDELAERREQHGVLARLVWVVHADELPQRVRQLAPVVGMADGRQRGQMQRRIGEPSASLVLLQQHVHQVHQRVGLAKAGEQEALFELFVVVLDERADDPGRLRQRLWRQVLVGLQASHCLAVDQQDAFENAVLAHQVLCGRDFLFRLLERRRRSSKDQAPSEDSGGLEEPPPADLLWFRHGDFLHIWERLTAVPCVLIIDNRYRTSIISI